MKRFAPKLFFPTPAERISMAGEMKNLPVGNPSRPHEMKATERHSGLSPKASQTKFRKSGTKKGRPRTKKGKGETKFRAYLFWFLLYRTKVHAYLFWFLLYGTKIHAYLFSFLPYLFWFAASMPASPRALVVAKKDRARAEGQLGLGMKELPAKCGPRTKERREFVDFQTAAPLGAIQIPNERATLVGC